MAAAAAAGQRQRRRRRSTDSPLARSRIPHGKEEASLILRDARAPPGDFPSAVDARGPRRLQTKRNTTK